MMLFDDIHPTEKVKVYDKNIKIEQSEVTAFKPVYRTGDIWIPTFDQSESLAHQVDFLYKALIKKRKNYFTAQIALKILSVLESASSS